MERKFYNHEPAEIETIRCFGAYVTSFRLDIERVKDGEVEMEGLGVYAEGETGEAWACNEVAYPHRDPLSSDDRPKLIALLVRARYSADAMEAITNNYLLAMSAEDGEANGKATAEFREMQAWRTEAKRLVGEAMAM